MIRYKNLGRDSGINSYELGPDYIRVAFEGLHVYLYTNDITGEENIEQMKQLAERGEGLNEFINKYVRKNCIKES